MKWPRESERAYWAELCRDSFWHFTQYAWGMRFNPEGKFIYPPLHRQFCDWFQRLTLPWLAARGTPNAYRLYLAPLLPRRTGKSTYLTRAGNAWLHLHEPNLATAIGAMDEDLAKELFSPIRTAFKGQDRYAWFPWLYGSWYNPAREDRATKFTHAARTNLSKPDPSFAIFGIETGSTGKHPDVVDLDDPTDYDKLRRDSNWYNVVNDGIAGIDYVLASDGLFIMPGTRYGDGDQYGTYLNVDGVRSISGMQTDQFEITPDGKWDVFFWDVLDGPNMDTARLTVPTVHTRKSIKAAFRRNPLRAASQLRNNPAMSPDNPLTKEDLLEVGAFIAESELPSYHNMPGSIHLDLALIDDMSKPGASGSKKNKSVIAVAGHYTDGSGRVVFLDSEGDELWKADQFFDILVSMIRKWRRKGLVFRGITDDRILGGPKGAWRIAMESSFKERGIAMPQLFEIHRSGRTRKDKRLRSVIPFWRTGKVKLLVTAPGLDQLVYQMTHIGLVEDDDYADAFADVFYDPLYRGVQALGGIKTDGEESVEQPMDYYLKGGLARDAEALIERLS